MFESIEKLLEEKVFYNHGFDSVDTVITTSNFRVLVSE